MSDPDRPQPVRRRFLRLDFGPRRVEQDVDAELAFHIEMRVRRLIERGMDPAAARAKALDQFGDWDTVRAEAKKACAILGVKELLFEEIPAAQVSEQPIWKLNRVIGALVEKVKPDVLYAPWAFDLHKDHREIFHSLSVSWRPSSG